MEAKLLPLLTQHLLPIPETNEMLRIAGKTFEVDFLWRRHRVVVETDGGQFHDNPMAQKRDAERNRILARAGYRVPRIGWEQLATNPIEPSPRSPVPPAPPIRLFLKRPWQRESTDERKLQRIVVVHLFLTRA